MSELPREKILGAKITNIWHSNYSDPTWIVEGIGPASFRSHFISLDSGLVLDLFTADISLATTSSIEMPGETHGISVGELIGRTITALQRDNVHSSLVILDHYIFLRDANDGFTENPLRAGFLEEYSAEELAQFIDYWTEQPVFNGHRKEGS